jgi:hypothetical protein
VVLQGLAKHLFGDVECRWVDAYVLVYEVHTSAQLQLLLQGVAKYLFGAVPLG